jgi:hypothetical protein
MCCQPHQELLEGFNSDDNVACVPDYYCPFTYPD